MAYSFVLTGGGTGGHVFPALAVARILRDRSHRVLFAGLRSGIEASLVPQAGFDFTFVRSGALNRVGRVRQLRTSLGLPANVASAIRVLRQFGAQAVFSTGGYVAGPVMLASLLARIPLVVMEPNAVPGVANRWVGRRVCKALVGFSETAAWFPPSRVEITGLPVRAEFFQVERKREARPFTVLVTGGSRGARSLNRAARESWPLWASDSADIRMVLQTGEAEHQSLAREFEQTGLSGAVVPFISDMAEAFSGADLVVARAGAGSVNELAAAGMPSMLVPFPFAADDHQKKNAEALARVGAARLVPDAELSGDRLYKEVQELRHNREELRSMGERVKQFAHPQAAERAAEVLEEAARSRKC